MPTEIVEYLNLQAAGIIESAYRAGFEDGVASVETPAQPASAVRTRTVRFGVAFPERDEVIKRMAFTCSWLDVATEINKLPGPPVRGVDAQLRAANLGLRSPNPIPPNLRLAMEARHRKREAGKLVAAP